MVIFLSQAKTSTPLRSVGIKILIVLSFTSIFCGCVNYAGIHSHKKIAHPAQFMTKSIPEQHGVWPTYDWAEQFGDPQLVELIKEALANNPSLEIAAARIAQARATVRGRVAALYPNVRAGGNVYRVRLSSKRFFPPPLGNSYFTQTGFLASLNYNLDIWGKNRANLRQAISEAKASEAEEQETRLTIATSVASTYNQLAYYYDLRDLLRRTVRQRSNLARITSVRLQSGLDTNVQLYQARNQTAEAKTQLAEVDGQIVITKQQLGTLLGSGPDRGLLIKRPSMKIRKTPPLPDNLPLNLLGRRPDIVKARWEVEAACQGIKFVQAQFYPNINLKAGVAYFALALSQFTIKANAEYIGPAITLPIFDAGALRARLKGQYALYEEAVATYNLRLNDAFSDVVTKLSNIQSTNNQLKAQSAAIYAASQAYQLAREQYRTGLASQLVALDSETNLLRERESQLKLLANRRNLQIALIKALGGGFDACCRNPIPMSK